MLGATKGYLGTDAGLVFAEREISLSKEFGKEVWEQLHLHFPVYALLSQTAQVQIRMQ